MYKLNGIEPKRVFEIFEEISAIPRGSGNMKGIADYCVAFAEKNNLKSIRDNADNVVIFKDASKGYENSEPIILQGHLDIVCQKTEESNIDFQKDGLQLFVDGDFLKAKGTTLGADNGIAVAMVMAILENDDILHPAIEAVFTTDEEIGMIGASKLDTSVLTAKKMINLDSEALDTVTVSCAGGSDFKAAIPFERKKVYGTSVKITLKGLKGGHSGICINEGRLNANVLAGRFLDFANKNTDFELISVNGGDKGNAIPLLCEVEVCTEKPEEFEDKAKEYLNELKLEIAAREPNFNFEIIANKEKVCSVICEEAKENIIYALLCCPDGVMQMSAEIDGLVETSLNLGILKTEENSVFFNSALRSNKKTALCALEEKLITFFKKLNFEIETAGHYPPWEYNANSVLREVYKETFTEQFGYEPKVEAIHAGLECGVFYDKIADFDCIAIGPQLYDVHTPDERLSISSTEKMYKLLIEILRK